MLYTAEKSPALYEPASDGELLLAGYDPACIEADADADGPYRVCRLRAEPCAHCGAATEGATVVNVQTATGISVSWTHADAFHEAEENARSLNGVWLAGYRVAEQAKKG